MSAKSNNQGRAYEYVIINKLCAYIKKYRPAHILPNSSLNAAKDAYDAIPQSLKDAFDISADAAIAKLYELEPLIFEEEDELELLIQKDSEGEEGDVRDILLIRAAIGWEIGLSVKHNHFAVKHSRLSPTADFGQKWYGIKCSDTYWKEINAVFDQLDPYIAQGKEWNQVPNKKKEIYVPILNAFSKELMLAYEENGDICKRFAEYLLGKNDYYKVISQDSKRITQIQGYQLHGQLNKKGKRKPGISVPLVRLPDEIYHIGMKKRSFTTVEITMNNGWAFSFRLHNGDRKVEKSLKFDVEFLGDPGVTTLDCAWTS